MKHAPAVDAGGRLILATQGKLIALVEEQGKPRIAWDYVVGSHVPGRVVIAPDGTLRIHSADGLVHAVNEDGRQTFSPVQVGEPLGFAAPVVDAAGNTWISAYNGGLIRLHPDGRPDASLYFRSRMKFDSAGIIVHDFLYIGSEEGYVFAIDLSGERGSNAWDHAIEQGYTAGFINSSPALAPDGTIVVAARDQAVYSFTPAGETVWSVNVPGQLLGSPVIDRAGNVYVGVSLADRGQAGRGALVSIDGNSRKLRWQYPVSAAVESTPVIGDDEIIYFGDNGGTIHAVDNRGNAQWTAQVESPVRAAGIIYAPGRLAFGLDDDTLVVLECSSKSLATEGWPKIARTFAQSGMAE
jgi:outer membrane protein assembly factor BamB